ncbi:MAG: phage/plasmid primase, P4 family, partial [Pirellula sp.]
PCPKCGGKDRFKVMKDFDQSGGVICNQCGKFSDGLATIQWFINTNFLDALAKVAQCVGVEPDKLHTSHQSHKSQTDPAKNLHFHDVFPLTIASIWAATKPPIAPESLQIVGARYATYRRQYPVFALPAIGKDNTPYGYFIAHATGKTLPIFERGNKEPTEWRKSKLTSGSQAGWIGPTQSDSIDIIWKTEGPSDLLALLTLGLLPNHSACTNLFGCGEDPASNPWMLDRFKEKIVYVIHDCDQPGQSGSIEVSNGSRKRPGWAPAIANVARECRNVVLPYPIEPSHGKDLRDWISERLAENLPKHEIYQRLLELAQRSNVITAIKLAEKSDSKSDSKATDISQLESKSVDDPFRLARVNIENYKNEHKRHIRYWKETFYTWKNGKYEEMTVDHFTHGLGTAIEKEFHRAWRDEAAAYINWTHSPDYQKELDRGCPKERKVTGQITHNTLAATKSICALRNSQKMHAWTDGHDEGHCISLANGILNISKAIAEPPPPESEILLPHSPDWFSTTKLNFPFDPNAQCPNWIKFLRDIFNDDTESIDLLQKWFGYLLTPDNSLQKILFIIGQRRSGKGTIVQIMKDLFGESNIATPKLSHLAMDFGLQTLVDKSVGIITDARLSRRTDETAVMECLLSISGGDPQDVNRKHKDALTAHAIKVRFTVFSNEVPNLRDFSEAFVSRCIFLLTPNSYLGREDFELQNRLRRELSGILNWAIIGRHLLNEFPRLKQPPKGLTLSNTLKSPVLRFIEERVEFTQDAEETIETSEFFDQWSRWSEEEQLDSPGTVQSLFRMVKAINPNLETEQRRIGDDRIREIRGAKWKPRKMEA